MALEAKDARDWVYRGEGAANLILAYTGNSPNFVGKVLRIQKISANESLLENDHRALSSHECLLWKDMADLATAPAREIVDQLYVKHVMCPLLGSNHVDPGMHIPVSKEFLAAVENNVRGNRPSWRVDAAVVNAHSDCALLLSDHSVFPHGILSKEKSFLSVEIKPKCGFLPISEFIAEDNAIKRTVTRFKMHQALKALEKKTSEISQYDPLDMFSGSNDGVLKAVKALFTTPQNNFRVFLNGNIIFGGSGGGAKSTDTTVAHRFEDALKRVILGEDGMRTNLFLELVANALYKSGALDRLLEVQKLDTIDIEGAIHAYYNIVSEPCAVCRETRQDKLLSRYAGLHSIPRDESLKIVRNYLIAATAKDLSMMLTFQLRENQDTDSPYYALTLEPNHQTFDYKVAFIDLDMKLLRKMKYYYELDQQIVRFYVHKELSEPLTGSNGSGS